MQAGTIFESSGLASPSNLLVNTRKPAALSIELVCLFDSSFTLIRVSHTWASIFGIAEEIATGLSFFEFVPEQQHRQIESDLAALGPELRTVSCMHAVGLQSDVKAWIDWEYRVILDKNEAVLAYEAVGKFGS